MKKVFTNDELKSLEKLFQLKQETLLKVMKEFLKKKYDTVFATKDYIMAIGDKPVALVAHLDTVFPEPPDDIYYDRVKNVLWSPDGLGADDRAGVYAILQIVRSGLRPTVILTTDEEYGGLGADVLTQSFPECPTDLNYIIELDRRGKDDCVFYDCDNPQFISFIEDYGFTYEWGSFSDISVICPDWKVAGVNLSIGYKNEHSVSETLNVSHMWRTINIVKKMVEESDCAPAFEYIPSQRYKWFSPVRRVAENILKETGYDPAYGISPEQWVQWMEGTQVFTCKNCGDHFSEYNVWPVKAKGGGHYYLCNDCLTIPNAVHWCKNCEEAFQPKSKDDYTSEYCENCEGQLV